MRFLNINNVKRNTIFVLPVEPVERGNLPAKRRSSVAAEDKYDGLLVAERTQTDTGLLVERAQSEVVSRPAGSKRPSSRARPQRLKREHNKQGSRHLRDSRREALRWLAH